MSGSLNLSLLKKIVDSVRGFDGEKSGISGHFALRTKCCFTMNGQKRSLDVQAPSEAVKDDWVSAIKLMVAYFQLGGLSSHAERMKLEEALVSRRFVRQALKNRQKNGHTLGWSGTLKKVSATSLTRMKVSVEKWRRTNRGQ